MNDNIKKLYDVLSSKGYYTKSFEDFSGQWSDEEYRKKVYGVVSRDGLYTKDYSSFVSKYSASVEPIKKKEPTVSPSQSAQKPSSSGTQPKKPQPRSVFLQDSATGEKLEVLTGYPGKEDIEYNFINGQWRKRKPGQTSWFTITNQGSINELNRFFNKQKTEDQVKKQEATVKRAEAQTELSDDEMAKILGWDKADVQKAKEGKTKPVKPSVAATVTPTVPVSQSSVIDKKTANYAKANIEVAEGKAADVNQRAEYYNNIDLQNKIKEAGFDVDVNGDMNTPKNKSALAKYEAFTKKNAEDMEKKNKFLSSVYSIDDAIGNSDEETLVSVLRDKYKGTGFVFEETGLGDTIRISYAPTSQMRSAGTYSNTIEIPLGEENSAALIKSFMENAYMTDTEKKVFAADTADTDSYTMDLVSKMAENPYKYDESLVNEDWAASTLKNRYEYLSGESINLENLYRKYDEAVKDYNENPTQDKKAALSNMLHSIEQRKLDLMREYEKVEKFRTNLDKVAGIRLAKNEKIGNTLGMLTGAVAQGATSIGKTLTLAAADVLPYAIGEDVMNPIERAKLESQGYTEYEILDQSAKELKRFIMPRLEEGIQNVASLGTTTREYVQSEDRGDIAKAATFLAESIGTAISGGGNPLLQKLAFASMSYNSMEQQMMTSDFDKVVDPVTGEVIQEGLTEHEKKLVSIPYAFVIGALEKLGWDAMSNKGLLSKVAKNVIRKTMTDLPKDASIAAVKREINKSVGKMVASGAIRIVNGALSEGAVEGVQQLAEIGIKNVANAVTDVDYFKDVPDLTTTDGIIAALDAAKEDAYYGVLGGLMFSGIDVSRETASNMFYQPKLDKEFDMFYESIMNDDTRTLMKMKVESDLAAGEISKEDAEQKIRSLDENKARLDKIPADLSSRDKRESFNLLMEREKLEKQIAGKEENLVAAQKARISEINNELQTISQNAVKESTEQQQEGPAEGGGVQYQGTKEGQPEVREGERTEGQAAQPEADLGDRVIEGGRVEEEVASGQPTMLRQAINRPATLSQYGGTTFESPLKGDIYVDGQQVVFEERSTGRVYELGNVDQVIDTQIPGLNTEQERISITKDGKVSIDGNNWNIQSELPTQGIEYTPAGEVMRVSLKDDTGRTAMFDGQDAVDIAYQIELQKYQTPEQQKFINELLEQDEEFKQATANIKPAEAAAIIEEEAAADTVQATEEEIDDEVSRLEELLGKKTPKFQKGEQGAVDFDDVDKITEEINQMPEDSANFDVPSDLSTKNKSNIKSLINRFSQKLKAIKNGGVIKDISEFNGIPFIFTISDQLSSGQVKNPFTGNTIDVNGGLGFSLTDGNENNAWANTTSAEAEKTLSRAKEVYNKNKDLFDRLWAEGKLPNGHVPMAVVKMGQDSILTNEALFRFAADTIRKKFSKSERSKSLNGLIDDIVDFEIESENRRREKAGEKLMNDKEIDSMSRSVMSSDKIIKFIKDKKFETIDELLESMNELTPISSRARITKILFTGSVDKKTNPERGNVTKKSALALVGNKDKSFRKYIHLNTINESIQEEATKDIPKNHVIAIVGVDVVNGKVTSSSNGEVTHRNYPYGVKGKLIGVIESPVNVADVFPEAYARVFVMNKPNKSGAFPSVDVTVDQAVASSGAIASMKTLRGAKLSSKITDLQKLLAKMRIAFPSVSVFETQEEFEKAIQDPNVNKFIKKGDVIYGFTIDGKVYLNPEKANSNTAIHEFAHIWMGFLRENNPELLRKGFSLLEGTDILRKKIEEFGDTDLAREEAMAEIIASKGEAIIEAGKKSKFKNWLNATFNYIKSKFKAFDKLTPEEFQKLSLNEFVDGSLSVLLGGKEVTEADIKSLQVMFSKTNKIDDIISIARENGFSDAAIKKYLEKSGFDQKDINAAMRQRKSPSVSKILGKPAPKKVTVNEAAALKDQLKLEARAARQSAQSLKQKQRQLVAMINEMKRGGIVTAQQASALAKRVVMTNVDNPIMVERMLQYAERLFERADYQEKLQEAKSLQKKIKSKLKSNGLQASVVSIAKDFSKIQPWMLSDIDAYIEQANAVLSAVRPSRQTADMTVDIRTAMSFGQVGQYVEEANKEIEEYRKAEILAVNDDLVQAGVISKDMNLKEILEIIGELRDPETKLPAEDKKAAILAYIGSVMDVYRPIVESMISGMDAFTGEAVELTDRQKEVASDMLKIDVTKMDVRDAVRVIEAMDNFITNGIIDGVEAITNTYKGQQNAEQVSSKGLKTKSIGAGKIGSLWGYNMMSLPVLSDWIFRGTNRAQYVLDKMGVTDFINGVSRATSRWRNYIDEYHNEFNKKKANGKNFMDAENIYERGMYAFLKRTVTGDQAAQDKELKRKIKLIKDSVNVLREEGDAKDAKVADMYEMLIDKLGLNDANLSISDIEARVDKVNMDAVNWWINTWSDNYGQLADVSQSIYNTILDKDMFYTPDKFSSLDPNNSKNVDELMDKMGGGGFASVLNYEYDKKTGVLMPSSKPVSMEQKRYVNLNFDNNNQRALKAALVDINTAAATKQIKGFFKSRSWNKIVSNKEDRDLFRKRVDEYILRARNKQTGSDDRTIGDVERSLRLWASMGATRALGSVFQPFKQTIPVFVNTLFNTGKHITFAFSRDQHRWIDALEMPISNRGIESIAAFEDADKNIDRSITAGKLDKAIEIAEKVNTKWLKLVLAKPDVFAARSSFIAYYKKALEAKGKSTDIDYSNPADVDQEALNYAQHMVDRQQNASDAMLMGDLFTSGQSLKKILKNTLFPFMSFVINQKSRMTTDFSIWLSKDSSKEDRKAAAWSLAGLAAEMAAFHSLSFAIKYYIVNAIASAIGGEDEPEEEDVKKSLERQLSYTIGTIVKDIFSPVPVLTDTPVIYGSDWLMEKIAPSYMEDDAKEALKTENEVREIAGKPILEGKKAQDFIDKYIEERRYKASSYDSQGPGGVYRITLDKGIELYKSMNLAYNGEFETEGFGGKMETKYIDSEGKEKMKEIMPYYMAWAAFGIPAEFGSIFRKIENNVKKEHKLTEKQHEALNEVLKETGRQKEGKLEKYLVTKMRATQNESASERVLNELDWIESRGGLKNERQVQRYIEIFEADGSVGIRDMEEIQKLK